MASGVHKVDISWDRRSSGTVANVVFDNSRRLNVLNPPALLDLTEAFLGLAREDDLRVVVLSGAGGRAFIGGADINHMVTMKVAEDGRAFLTLIHKLCQSIRDCPVPVICRLEGYTLGAGLEVAAACDMRIAADNAHLRHAGGECRRALGGRGGAAAAPDRLGPDVAPVADGRDDRRRQGGGVGPGGGGRSGRRTRPRQSSAACMPSSRPRRSPCAPRSG